MASSAKLTSAEDEELKDLGYSIQRARLRRNISQDELAVRTGMSRTTVVRLEKGEPGVSIGTLCKVLAAFGFDDALSQLLRPDLIGEAYEETLGRKRARQKK